MRGLSVAAAVVSFALVGGADAAQLKIVDVKAYAFLEHAGKLSDDLVSGGESLIDAPKGGALGGDTATGLLIDFTFEGDKNASPKYATAVVDLMQTGRSGQPITTPGPSPISFLAPTGSSTKPSSWKARPACRSPSRSMRARPKRRRNSISTARKPSPRSDAVSDGSVISPCSTPRRRPSNKALACGPSPKVQP
jgi:hypothetical protein